VDFMIVDPPLVLPRDGLNSSLDLIHPRHGTCLYAFDGGGLEAIDRFLILALPAQCRHFFADVHGCHGGIFLCRRIGGS
jgi:hypothetical protein